MAKRGHTMYMHDTQKNHQTYLSLSLPKIGVASKSSFKFSSLKLSAHNLMACISSHWVMVCMGGMGVGGVGVVGDNSPVRTRR